MAGLSAIRQSKTFLARFCEAGAPTIWIADAHRGDGKRFVVRANEKLTTLVELESAVNRI